MGQKGSIEEGNGNNAPERFGGVPKDYKYYKWPQEFTPKAQIPNGLDSVELKAGDVLLDFGSGDGRICIAAAQLYGARGIGYEIDPKCVRQAEQDAETAGVRSKCAFHVKDLFEAADQRAQAKEILNGCTVLWICSSCEVLPRLDPVLDEAWDRGMRIVTMFFHIQPRQQGAHLPGYTQKVSPPFRAYFPPDAETTAKIRVQREAKAREEAEAAAKVKAEREARAEAAAKAQAEKEAEKAAAKAAEEAADKAKVDKEAAVKAKAAAEKAAALPEKVGGRPFIPGMINPIPQMGADHNTYKWPQEFTPLKEVTKGLDSVGVQEGDVLLDFGSGDGRICVAAAQRGAKAIGYEIDARCVREAQKAAEDAGVSNRCTFHVKDLFVANDQRAEAKAMLKDCTVLFISASCEVLAKINPLLNEAAERRLRIVTHPFHLQTKQRQEHLPGYTMDDRQAVRPFRAYFPPGTNSPKNQASPTKAPDTKTPEVLSTPASNTQSQQSPSTAKAKAVQYSPPARVPGPTPVVLNTGVPKVQQFLAEEAAEKAKAEQEAAEKAAEEAAAKAKAQEEAAAEAKAAQEAAEQAAEEAMLKAKEAEATAAKAKIDQEAAAKFVEEATAKAKAAEEAAAKAAEDAAAKAKTEKASPAKAKAKRTFYAVEA